MEVIIDGQIYHPLMALMGYDDLIIAIVMMVASYIIQTALAPKQQQPLPDGLDKFDFPQIDDGTPQCVCFGDVWIKDWMVLAVGNYRTSPIKAPSGGK